MPRAMKPLYILGNKLVGGLEKIIKIETGRGYLVNGFNTAYYRRLFSFQSVWSQEVPIGCAGLCSPFLDMDSVG